MSIHPPDLLRKLSRKIDQRLQSLRKRGLIGFARKGRECIWSATHNQDTTHGD